MISQISLFRLPFIFMFSFSIIAMESSEEMESSESNYSENMLNSSEEMSEQEDIKPLAQKTPPSAKRKLNFDPLDEEKAETPKKKKVLHDATNNDSPSDLHLVTNVFQTKTINISPIKALRNGGPGQQIRKGAVYIHFAAENEDFSAIPPHNERIDFAKIYDREIKDKEKRLNKAFLAIEKQVNKWKKNSDGKIEQNTIYVGLAKNASKRIQGHKSDCAKIRNRGTAPHCESSKKREWISFSWQHDREIRMSCVVYNVPPKYLPAVEVLLGELLDTKNKGNTLLGNDDAYLIINSYRQSDIYRGWLRKNNKENSKSKKKKDIIKDHFELSPAKKRTDRALREDVVYIHFFCEDRDCSFIPKKNKRVNFGELLNDVSLEDALLEVETKIISWIVEDERVYHNATYVGLAFDAAHRYSGHKSDYSSPALKSSLLLPRTQKERYLKSIWKRGSLLRMSGIVFNIPREHLPVVEVLVGELVHAKGKGNSALGNDQAYETVTKYFQSENRIKTLANLEHGNICQTLKNKDFIKVLNKSPKI